jgi:uncharacterized protein
MKLHTDNAPPQNTVTAYGPGWVAINNVRHEGGLMFMPEGEVLAWHVQSFEALEAADFEALLERSPEVVLLGTGERQRFPHPRLSAALAAAGVGLDAMTTHAACRTYNILAAEGRRVLAVLLPA